MLQARSFRTANQENPHAPQQQHPSKTPLRQQPLAGPSKGAFKEQAAPQTGKSGRVLGNKDGNQGRQSNPGQSRFQVQSHLHHPAQEVSRGALCVPDLL